MKNSAGPIFQFGSSKKGFQVRLSEQSKLIFWPTSSALRFGALLFAMAQAGELTLSNKRTLDIGSGSGFLGIIAAKLGADVDCTELNPLAPEIISANARDNCVTVFACAGNGITPVKDRGPYDFVILNPPLILNKDDPTGAWLIAHVVKNIDEVLSRSGTFLFYTTSIVDIERLMDELLLKGYQVAHRTRIAVCVNRIEFWAAYSTLPLEELVHMNKAWKRQNLYGIWGAHIIVRGPLVS